jgi:hypothetical protein
VSGNSSFTFAGPAGRLEALLVQPAERPLAAAVVCHAHPLHGGMMHFKVVFRAAKAMQHQGVAALRFNFRGVGLSEGAHDHGAGEQDDVGAALDEMERRFPGLPLVLGGFSFGSAMALRVAAKDSRVRAVFALGFPVESVPDTSHVDALRMPRLFVQGENDSLGGKAAIATLVARLPEPKQLHVVGASDHFFTGHLDELQEAIARWAAERPWEAA